MQKVKNPKKPIKKLNKYNLKELVKEIDLVLENMDFDLDAECKKTNKELDKLILENN